MQPIPYVERFRAIALIPLVFMVSSCADLGSWCMPADLESPGPPVLRGEVGKECS